MKSQDIVKRYFEGYSVKQLVDSIYEDNKNSKGNPTITKAEALSCVESQIIQELKRLNQEQEDESA